MNKKPSEQAKEMGLRSLARVAELCNKRHDTLIRWHRDNPQLFKMVLQGCAVQEGEYLLKRDVMTLLDTM